MSMYSKLACFAGGVLFGTVGLPLLTGKEARKVYVHAAAAGLRAKDSIMETVTSVQECAADVLASAKDLNEERAAAEAAAEAAATIEDSTVEDDFEQVVEA